MDRRLTILIGENGSIKVYSEDLSTNQQRWISGIFLLVCFSIGLGLGLAALLGLRYNSGYRRALIGLVLTTVLDTIQGQILGAVFLVVTPNLSWCRVSACTSTILLMIQSAEVTLLNYNPHLVIDVLPWIFGGSMIILIAAFPQCSPIYFYPQRHGCSITGGGDAWIPQTVLTVWLGGNWLGMAAGLSDFHGASSLSSKLDVFIARISVVMYGLLVLPHGLILLATSFSARQNSGNVYLHETVFIWARYLFNLIIPLIVLLAYKDVRSKSKSMVFWCKEVSSIPNTSGTNNQVQKNIKKLKNVLRRKKKIEPLPEIKCNPTTPVLFATSQGLYLRTVGQIIDESNFKSLELVCVRCDHEYTETPIRTEVDIHNEAKKNVRFSSQINEVPLTESGIWSNEDGDAHKCSLPHNHEVGITFTKLKQ